MIDPRALYVMTMPDGWKNLALDVQRWGEGGRTLAFHDTCRGHTLEGEIIETPEGVTVNLDNGNTITFEIVTLDTYRREYKALAVNGDAIAAACNSTGDLWEYYRRRLREDFL